MSAEWAPVCRCDSAPVLRGRSSRTPWSSADCVSENPSPEAHFPLPGSPWRLHLCQSPRSDLRLECAAWFQRAAILSRVLRLLHEQFLQFPNWVPKTGLGDLVGEQVGIWVNSLVTNDYPLATIFNLLHLMAHVS